MFDIPVPGHIVRVRKLSQFRNWRVLNMQGWHYCTCPGGRSAAQRDSAKLSLGHFSHWASMIVGANVVDSTFQKQLAKNPDVVGQELRFPKLRDRSGVLLITVYFAVCPLCRRLHVALEPQKSEMAARLSASVLPGAVTPCDLHFKWDRRILLDLQ